MTQFTDIFKKNFIENITIDLNVESIIMALLSSFICGMIIYLLYKNFFRGVIYNNNFNILLVLLCMITSFIVLTISSNVVLSLGMVGALSIVRFRTAVKDPLDLGFLFWSIAIGITCGAGLYIMSFLCTIFIGVIFMLLVQIKNTTKVYLLIVKYDNKSNEEVQRILKNLKHILKNKTVLKGKTEITVEIKSKVENTSFVTILSEIEGVYSSTLVEYSGDFGE